MTCGQVDVIRDVIVSAVADVLPTGVQHTNTRTTIVAQSATSARLVTAKIEDRNAVHAVLTLLTCGMWLIGWLIVVAVNQHSPDSEPQTALVLVDEWGTVHWS
jgi:hypothetical protein